MQRVHARHVLMVLGALLVIGLTAYRLIDMERGGASSPPTIGIVHLTEVNADAVAGFKSGMAELGYLEGKTVHYRYDGPAGRIERLDPMLRAQLADGVDLFYTMSTPATRAARRITLESAGKRAATPVVFGPLNDPVKSGVVADQRRPGGNITGVRLPEGGDGLRLQWLTRVVPKARRILFPYNPNDPSAVASLNEVRQASHWLEVELVPQPVPDVEAILAGIRDLPAGIDAIFLPRDSLIEARVGDYVAAANPRRIPVCGPSADMVKAGALLSYGFSQWEIGHQVARFADQVLRGVPPADLPVETAHNYLALNLATARVIGLDIPNALLRQAHKLVR